MDLPDETKVFPGHGAGSSCGKKLSTATSSTIGEQRLTNYAVRAPDLETFVRIILEDPNSSTTILFARRIIKQANPTAV